MREYTVTIEKHDGSTAVRNVYAKDRDDAMAFAKNIFRYHCKKVTKCSLAPNSKFVPTTDELLRESVVQRTRILLDEFDPL